MRTYIAIDIGASSGRLMASQVDPNGCISLTEIHRFKNSFRSHEGKDRWDIRHLIREIVTGLEKAKKKGIDHCYVGIDTWAVDYCLVGAEDQLLADPISYRDGRTADVLEDFSQKMPLEKVYEKTGIQIQPFNTIFQLFVEEKELLKRTKQILLIPDYLGFYFTDKAVLEETNASTMQLLNVQTKQLDPELLEIIGVRAEQFPSMAAAGTKLGKLNQAKFKGYDLPEATFITVASHDTASAVIGTPGIGDDWAYISSGTWSLLGVERPDFLASPLARQENYTNEWGAFHTIRFLKNIMGMWLIQEVARDLEYQYTFPELAEMASREEYDPPFINVNDPIFLNPKNMIAAIQDHCRETKQKVPATPAQIARTIYVNLALCYGIELEKLERLIGHKIIKLQIVGGGSNAAFLNQLTADATNITVEAGPTEATAIGNVVIQMVAVGEFPSVTAARAAIRSSFDMQIFNAKVPQHQTLLSAYKEFLNRKKDL